MTPSNEDPLAVPRGELDAALAQVVQSARAALAAQDRLRALLKATQIVAEPLELATVLQRIVDAAVHLVGAEYGALGVIDATRSGLEQFVYEGVSPEVAAEIGHLPEGHGVLGALIAEPSPIRLEHLADDERSAGFPAHHPAMDSFLGVPIRVRGEVFGNLYLTNQRSNGRFSSEDEELVTSLAITAGFSIENARLYAETRRRQRWSAATAEITATLLSAEDDDPIAVIAERVLTVSNAAHVRIVVPTEDGSQLIIHTARGVDADIEGQRIPRAASVSSEVLDSRTSRLLSGDDVNQLTPLLTEPHRAGSIVAVPLIAEDDVRGTLVVIREVGARRFTASDVEMISDFAGQVTLAMVLLDARVAHQHMMLYEDRARIARDLHDHVIQLLFANGLELQSLKTGLAPRDGERVEQVISGLDEAIAQIRAVIFALSSATVQAHVSFRQRVIDLVADFDRGFEHAPTVAFAGPLDLAISGRLATDILAVVRESLANASKHAHGTTASVHVSVRGSAVEIEVRDDGNGMPSDPRRSGLSNLQQRAIDHGGDFWIQSDASGTALHWCAPLTEMEEPDVD